MAGDHDRNERHSMHPYRPVPPYVYRILMPDAGPAAIAVSLPQKLSYCWDAGACRLRYAWQGDFIDPIDYWDKKGERLISPPDYVGSYTQTGERIISAFIDTKNRRKGAKLV